MADERRDSESNREGSSGLDLCTEISRLVELMARLREPETGCPWDLEQTYKTIAPSTIEEAYEVVDAIEREDYPHLREELGDLLFQVIFYAQLGSEQQRFTLTDIVKTLVDKLVMRHPHVFPHGTLESRIDPLNRPSQKDIKGRWEEIKEQERREKGETTTLAGVPLNLPALTRAFKLQKRASRVGFDWPDIEGVVAKIDEELMELKTALKERDQQASREEVGDLLFAVVNASRHLKLEPETALRATNSKFEQRFNYVEAQLKQKGILLEDASLEEMDELWEQAKRELQQNNER